MAATQDHSFWSATVGETSAFPALAGDIKVDVAIVGGGIVGVTTARLLKDMGQKVALVEARRVGRQVTGQSTAKISSLHGLHYQEIERKFGETRARLYAEAQEEGIRKIIELAETHGIDADIEPQSAFVYTCDKDHIAEIEREAELARRLGLPATLTRETGLPFDVLAALRFDAQAQFHPTKYVAGLAATLPGEGSFVFENSRVTDYEPSRIVSDGGSVTARHVVMATHLPLGQVGLYYATNAPKAEPVVAARIARPIAGMYKSAESAPSHSIRGYRGADGAHWAVATGTHFKPGHPDEEKSSFDDIIGWLSRHFGADKPEYRWVNEDYVPIDGAPFVGWSSSSKEAYLVATGFNAWGISNGTAAAMILADLATGRPNRWLEMFDATRVKPIAGAAQFAKANAEVAVEMVGGWLSRKPKSCDELAPGEAAILSLDGDEVAAFRDEAGSVHAVSAVCTHMGCLVGWNQTDRTWDCPCHGSRFGLSGEVIHGPATQPLGAKVTG